MQAAFINFGRKRHGFLAFNDIQTDYYQIPHDDKEKLKREEENLRLELKEKSNNLEVKEKNNSNNNDVDQSNNLQNDDSNEVSEKARELGVYFVLTKPIKSFNLLERLLPTVDLPEAIGPINISLIQVL